MYCQYCGKIIDDDYCDCDDEWEDDYDVDDKQLKIMIAKITTEIEYKQVMELIETYLQKATEHGGFHTLKKEEADELQRLSLLAEDYEDNHH